MYILSADIQINENKFIEKNEHGGFFLKTWSLRPFWFVQLCSNEEKTSKNINNPVNSINRTQTKINKFKKFLSKTTIKSKVKVTPSKTQVSKGEYFIFFSTSEFFVQ